MSVTVEIESEGFRNQLNQLANLGLNTGRILQVESRKFLKEVINTTPPSGGKSRVSQFETIDVGGREQGERAVEADILRVIRGVPDSMVPFLLKNNKDPFPRVFTIWHSGTTKFVKDIEHFSTSIDEVRAFHQKMRSKFTGRTPFFKNTKGMDNREYIGRNKSRVMMVCPNSVLKKYIREVKSHVGKMKGGWGPAAMAVGIKLPSWVSRHSEPKNGFVQANLGHGDSPSITIGNVTNGVRTKTLSAVQRALHNRTESIKVNVARMIKYGSGKSGDYGYATS